MDELRERLSGEEGGLENGMTVVDPRIDAVARALHIAWDHAGSHSWNGCPAEDWKECPRRDFSVEETRRNAVYLLIDVDAVDPKRQP
jgi:hypothetical protein